MFGTGFEEGSWLLLGNHTARLCFCFLQAQVAEMPRILVIAEALALSFLKAKALIHTKACGLWKGHWWVHMFIW